MQEFRLDLQGLLVKKFEGRFVLFTTDGNFELGPFATAGQCVTRARPWEPRLDTWWLEEDGTARRSRLTGWYEVDWQGESFEVVMASLLDASGCSNDFAWVVAATKERATAFFLAVCGWSSAAHGEVLVYEGGFSKSRQLYEAIRAASFDELVLGGALKESLRADLRRFLSSRELYARLKVPWKRGVLFTGPPGNGKTHAVRALVKESELPCVYVKSLRGGRGDPEEHIADIFRRARQTAPCVMVLEDLDCLIDESSRSMLLNELDGFAANEGLVIIATTNHPEKLDRSLLDRPSRFDRKFHFGLPGRAERLVYLERWAASLEPSLRPSEETVAALAEETHGFTFAYLKELTLGAMMSFMESPVDGAMNAIAPRVLEALRADVTSVEKTIGKLPVERPISMRS